MKHLVVVLLMIGLLAGCGKRRYVVKLPPEYMQVNDKDQTFATVPPGKTFKDAASDIDCGEQYICILRDLNRLILIEQHGALVMLQAIDGNSDLPKLVGCGETFLCVIDPVAKTLTIIKRK